MKNLLLIFVLLIPFLVNGEVEYAITHDQYYVIPENAGDNWLVGQFHANVSDTMIHERSGSYSFSIVSGNTNSPFAINSSTGMISINDSTVFYGNGDDDYTLGIQVSIDSETETKNAYIHVVDDANCKFVDMDAGSGGSGTRNSPYDQFSDVSSLVAGHAVFLKRGSTGNFNERVTITGTFTAANPFYLAAYGTSTAKPLIDNNNANTEGQGVQVATGIDNVYIYDIHAKDFYGNAGSSGNCFFIKESADNIMINRCEASNGGYNGEFYGESYAQISLRDCKGTNNSYSHNFKMQGSYDSIISCYAKSPHGDKTCFSLPCNNQSTNAVVCYSYSGGGGSQAITLRKSDSELAYNYCTSSWRLIYIYEETGDVADDNHIHHNVLVGDQGSGAIRLIDGNGVVVNNNIMIESTYGMYVGSSHAGGIVAYNNTIVQNTSDVTNNSSYNIEFRNNIYQNRSGSFSPSSNNYDYDSGDPFVNYANNDFHLDSVDATSLIDQGYNYGTSEDIDGVSIPQYSGWDIGAYEHPGGTTTPPGGDTSDMLAYWPFEEGSGTNAEDVTANSHDGTLTNGASFSGDAEVGSYSVLLDGDNDYVGTGSINLGSEFTICMWAKIPTSGVSSIQALCANSSSGSTTDGIRIFVDTYGTTDRKIIVETANGSSSNSASTATSAFAFDQWNHVAIAVDKTNGKCRIYYNGNVVTTDSTIRNDFATNQTFHLGQMTNNSWTMKGNLDDVRIYDSFLTGSEVDAIIAGEPTVTISTTDATATEAGPTTGTFRVSRGTDTSGNLTVYFSKSGSATFTNDYSLSPYSDSVIISNGNAYEDITLTPNNDSDVEGDETVILTLTSGSYTIGSSSQDTVTIVDDDPSYADMLAYWPFEEGSGTNAEDVTANSYDATLTNGASFSGDSEVGSYSVSFDGSNDYLTAGTVNVGSEFTLSMWVKINTGASNIQAVMANCSSGAGQDGFALEINTYGSTDQRIIFYTGNGSSYNAGETAGSTFTYNQWNHVAVAVDKSAGRAVIYYNGSVASTDSLIRSDFGTNQTLHMGQYTNSSWNMDGYLDDVRIYDYKLNASEVSDVYNKLKKAKLSVDTPEQNVSIYPLPFSDVLTVNNILEIKQIEVLDIAGKRMLIRNTNGNKMIKLNMGIYRPGYYIMRLTDHADQVTVRKLIKK